MLAIAISVLFGLIAFAALAQIHASVSQGFRHGQRLVGELARDERETLRARSAYRPEWSRELAAA